LCTVVVLSHTARSPPRPRWATLVRQDLWVLFIFIYLGRNAKYESESKEMLAKKENLIG
jgi:hypothetical protein